MTKRNKLEMKFAVLDACMAPLKVTPLMYQTNMNQTVLKLIVAELVEKGLLTEKVVGNHSFFKTSAAGYELLKEWQRLAAVVEA